MSLGEVRKSGLREVRVGEGRIRIASDGIGDVWDKVGRREWDGMVCCYVTFMVMAENQKGKLAPIKRKAKVRGWRIST